MCSQGDYRSAMSHEKEALTAFTSLVSLSFLVSVIKREREREKSGLSSCDYFLSQFGEDHTQTRCSTEFLCTITKQAVRVERSLRQAGAESTDQAVEVCSDIISLFQP